MENRPKEEAPHPLSVLAARVVHSMPDKPGTWDFEKVFKSYIALMDLESREAENRLAQGTEAANEGKQFYLFRRGLEIQKDITEAKKKVAEFKF